MTEKIFVDANVLIYAHDVDAQAKHIIAKELLQTLWAGQNGVLSTQVLQEFYVIATRKISRRLAKPAAREVVKAYSQWCTHVTADDLASAFQIEDRHQISFWDALIVAAALKSGAGRILSEDLNAGQKIAGITIENPFRSSR